MVLGQNTGALVIETEHFVCPRRCCVHPCGHIGSSRPLALGSWIVTPILQM